MVILAKICLCGDGAVGKTSIKEMYVGHGFQSDYLPTLGADFVAKEIELKINSELRKLRFQIWDLGGQPAFSQVRALYYQHAVGALLIFDVTRPDSLENLKNWMEELSKYSGSPSISVIVLGNKIDLQEETSDTLDAKTAQNFITEQLMTEISHVDEKITYYETSAITGKNIEKAFQELGLKIITKHFLP